MSESIYISKFRVVAHQHHAEKRSSFLGAQPPPGKLCRSISLRFGFIPGQRAPSTPHHKTPPCTPVIHDLLCYSAFSHQLVHSSTFFILFLSILLMWSYHLIVLHSLLYDYRPALSNSLFLILSLILIPFITLRLSAPFLSSTSFLPYHSFTSILLASLLLFLQPSKQIFFLRWNFGQRSERNSEQ